MTKDLLKLRTNQLFLYKKYSEDTFKEKYTIHKFLSLLEKKYSHSLSSIFVTYRRKIILYKMSKLG